MADLVSWRGASGNIYKYWSMKVSARVRKIDGNYIFAKKNETGGWEAVYVGQGDLGSRANVRDHYKGEQILARGATHIHVRANSSLISRMQEWADLLKGHPEAYEPTGCNGTSRGSLTGTG